MDGLHGIPPRDHYDDETAQGLEEITSLNESGLRSGGVLTQNPRTRQVPQERTSIVDHRATVLLAGLPERQQDPQ